MNTLYPNQINHISQIIERTRHHEEMFLIDGKKAATDIMVYLNQEGLLVGKVVPMEIVEKKEVCY